jgi:hypothetical protein
MISKGNITTRLPTDRAILELLQHRNGLTYGGIHTRLPRYTRREITTTCKAMSRQGKVIIQTVPISSGELDEPLTKTKVFLIGN